MYKMKTAALMSVFLMLHTNAYRNIALHKPAWQEFPNNSISGDAAKAVDGDLSSLTDSGEHCTVSVDGQKTSTWRVDLQQILPIHHITIHYRRAIRNGSPFIDQLAGYQLFVSNTTDKDDGRFCSYYYYYQWNNSSVQNITCPVYGRYVIYFNERRSDIVYPGNYSEFAYNDLCEVEVYGCSRPDSVGENCTAACPGENCTAPCPGYCDHCDKSGICLACKGDLAGPFCNKTESDNQNQTSDRETGGFPLFIILPVAAACLLAVLVLLAVVIVQRRNILKRRKEERDREGYMTYKTESNTYDMIQYRVSHEYEDPDADYEHVS